MSPRLLPTLALLAISAPASAERWENVTSTTIGTTAEWSNKVELADVDGDGRTDILFANGGDYNTPGTPEPQRIFEADGAGGFTEVTSSVIGPTGSLARVIKVGDVSGDGKPDIVIGATYQTQSRLFLGQGGGAFTEVTATNLPQGPLSVGDLEMGDVDGDGDLDLVLIDWGNGDPFAVTGKPHLWLNDGSGKFTDASDRMPDLAVGFSWDLELIDSDNDFDLDLLVSCKVCDGSFLLRNDGTGTFTEVTGGVPQFGNNYEFEPMDLDGDGLLDVVTINDGDSGREHLFRGQADGTFVDATSALWPLSANLPEDDNMVAFLDADDDGDADFLIGSLSGADRLLLNDGTGHLTLDDTVFANDDTPGTLGIAVADLNGDGKLDVVQSQGEVAFPDAVFYGVDVPVDTQPPIIGPVEQLAGAAVDQPFAVHARVNDHKSPTRAADWQEVKLVVTPAGEAPTDVPMTWVGEYEWRATYTPSATGMVSYQVCATDAQGNAACGDTLTVVVGASARDFDPGPDAGPGANGGGGGCGCHAARPDGGAALVLLALVSAWGRTGRGRRRSRPRP